MSDTESERRLENHSDPHDNCETGRDEQGIYTSQLSGYVQKKYDISVGPNVFERLITCGRGPISAVAESDRVFVFPTEIDRWVNTYLDVPNIGRFHSPGNQIDAASVSDECARWLIAGAEYNSDAMAVILRRWCASIDSRGPSPRDVLKALKLGRYDAALLDVDWNVEAGIVIADQLQELNIPFIVLTALWDVPSIFASRGQILHKPFETIRLGRLIRTTMSKEVVRKMCITEDCVILEEEQDQLREEYN